MSRQKSNFLDLIPCRGPLCQWEQTAQRVVVTHRNTGLWNRLAQLLYAAPKQTHFTLDALGSFIWSQLDGARTVADIAAAVSARFGAAAEPLYPRLTRYLSTLHENRFITFSK